VNGSVCAPAAWDELEELVAVVEAPLLELLGPLGPDDDSDEEPCDEEPCDEEPCEDEPCEDEPCEEP